MEQTLAEIERRMALGMFTQHAAVNAAKLVQATRNAALREALLGAEIVSADGMGIVLGMRLLGQWVPERVTGIDLFERLLAWAEAQSEPVYLLGGTAEVAGHAAAAVRGRHPRLNVAGWHDGYFWQDEPALVERIRASGASMLFVGISSPQKEQFIRRWRDALGVRFVMGIGGTLDVLAGRTRRAPLWMQRLGVEWLFRLMLEPRRLWRRYLLTNPQFVWLILKQRFSRR
jgi:N-acetylglucosaminyldiphosphoundecaprenol N-acetyl-beta-D-mannosaminyltransferase